MPWQLIYTSTPSGLTPGRSGFCVVARSRALPERLVSALERISIYEPLHGRPVIFSFRILSVGAASYGVISRYCDAGVDHTSRKNYLAHHLVFSSAEMALFPAPAEIARRWKGWRDSWTSGPQWFSDADSALPPELKSPETALPANTWKTLTKDAANAALFCPDGTQVETLLDTTGAESALAPDALLRLFAEASLLLRSGPWSCGFTTCAQPGDAAFQILWRTTAGGNTAEDFATARHVVRFCDLGPSSDISAVARLARMGKTTVAPKPALVTAKPKPTTVFKQPPIPPPPSKPEKPEKEDTVAGAERGRGAVPKLLPPGKPTLTPVADNVPPPSPSVVAPVGKIAAPEELRIPAQESFATVPTADEPRVSGSKPLTLALVFGAVGIGVLVVVGGVLAFFSGEGNSSSSHGNAAARKTGSPASISVSEIEKSVDADALNQGITRALARQDWETVAQMWSKLLATDSDVAARRKSEVLPRIQENLVSSLCARFERQAATHKNKKFKFESAKKNLTEFDNAIKLVSDVGANAGGEVQRRFEALGTYFALQIRNGESSPVDSVTLLEAGSPLPHIQVPRSLLEESRATRRAPVNVIIPEKLFDSLSRFGSRGFRFVLYPESESDVAHRYPDARNYRRGANRVSPDTINNIRKKASGDLKTQKQKHLEEFAKLREAEQRKLATASGSVREEIEARLRKEEQRGEQLQKEIYAIDGRGTFVVNGGRFIDQPGAWVLALSDGTHLVPLIRFK